MISGIDYGKGNDESCAITFVSPEYIEKLEQENQSLKELVNGLREERDYLFNKLSFENQSSKDRIEKAIEYIENSYYSKNTINIDDIAMTTNKCLKIREILKGDK